MIEGKGRGRQRLRWLDCITESKDMNLGELQAIVREREAWCAAVQEVAKSQDMTVTEQQQQQVECAREMYVLLESRE